MLSSAPIPLHQRVWGHVPSPRDLCTLCASVCTVQYTRTVQYTVIMYLSTSRIQYTVITVQYTVIMSNVRTSFHLLSRYSRAKIHYLSEF